MIDPETGEITGYKTGVGADTVFPFNSISTIDITLDGGVSSAPGQKCRKFASAVLAADVVKTLTYKSGNLSSIKLSLLDSGGNDKGQETITVAETKDETKANQLLAETKIIAELSNYQYGTGQMLKIMAEAGSSQAYTIRDTTLTVAFR